MADLATRNMQAGCNKPAKTKSAAGDGTCDRNQPAGFDMRAGRHDGAMALRQTAARHVHAGNQRGVAALEFALVISVFLVLMTGIIGMGGLLWVQQMLASAASEGARAVLDSSLRGSVDTDAGCNVAKDAASWLNVKCTPTPQACPWTMAGGAAAQCVAVDLSYDTSGWPLLSTMSALASSLGSNWIPESLRAHALVQIQEPS
jgi:hypothetical protein